MESKFQDDKHKLVGGGEWTDDYMELQNDVVDEIAKTSAYSESFDFDTEVRKITVNDPLEEISDEIQERERTLGSTQVLPANLIIAIIDVARQLFSLTCARRTLPATPFAWATAVRFSGLPNLSPVPVLRPEPLLFGRNGHWSCTSLFHSKYRISSR